MVKSGLIQEGAIGLETDGLGGGRGGVAGHVVVPLLLGRKADDDSRGGSVLLSRRCRGCSIVHRPVDES